MSAGRKQALLVALLLAGMVSGVARTQPRLAATAHRLKEKDDVWVLPPPKELRWATLGYTAAVTDLLWAKLLVEYGTHMKERHAFADLNLYLDAILALEPDYAPLYVYVDTMLVYRPGKGTEKDARDARRYLERGIAERPLDHKVWLQYGQFIAFLGPSFLTSSEEKDQWRRDGADAIMHAVELGADADRSLAASAMMKRWGKNDAAVRHLKMAFALTDDEGTRAQIARELGALEAGETQDLAERTVRAFEAQWRHDVPFAPRGEFSLLGPFVDPIRCAGPSASGTASCAHDWDEALKDVP